MSDKKFRHLSRGELVEIIYELQKREKELKSENEELTQKLNAIENEIYRGETPTEIAKKLDVMLRMAQNAIEKYAEDKSQLV